MPTSFLSPAAIALNRFGLGARLDDAPPANPGRWVISQFGDFEVRPAAFAALPDASKAIRKYQRERRMARAGEPVTEAPGPSRPRPATEPVMAPMPTDDAMVSPAPAVIEETPGGAFANRRRQAGRAARLAAAGTPNDARREARQRYRDDVRALHWAGIQARADSALATRAPFVERMVHFWANHFAVSADNTRIVAYAGTFERDAIRPHVLGRFEDMLLAVEHHPAMLMYLNQVVSIGPDSPIGRRLTGRQRGLNENLAREIMELHTLGVRSGYTQDDVTEFARALTGWTAGGIDGGGDIDSHGFSFRSARHQPGDRTILGERYAEGGESQGRAVIQDFARRPATAMHVATKVARHFAGDEPPPALVARLAADFTRTRGDLPSLYATLAASPECWVTTPTKFKSPWEWGISSMRGLGWTSAPARTYAMMQQLGQPVWKPGSPAGWDDLASTWAAPDALMRRVEVAARLTAPLGDKLDARTIGPRLLPASLSSATADQVGRAESPAGALALLLVSPDFLRR